MQHMSARALRDGWATASNGIHAPYPTGIFNPLGRLAIRYRAILPARLLLILTSEKVWRRTVPVLIGLLLCFCLLARTGSILDEAAYAEREAKKHLQLVFEITEANLNNNSSFESALANPILAQIFLEDALPRPALSEGQIAYLFDRNKILAARLPADEREIGKSLEQLFAQSLDRIPDRSTENLTIGTGGKIYDMIALRGLIGKHFENRSALLVVLQPTKSVLTRWSQNMRLDLTLLIGLAIVLTIFVYAYLAQSRRVNDIDQLFNETNARFDTALSRGHCGLWDWDLSRGRVVWSKSMFQMLGHTPSSNLQSYGEIAEMLHPNDTDLMMLANQAFGSREKTVDHRFRIMHANGNWLWLQLRAELLRHKDGTPHLIGIAVDVSEQESLRAQSKSADIRLRDAIENISEAFVLWDSSKRLVMCNSKYQQLYALPRSSIVSGARYDDIMAVGKKPRMRDRISSEKKREPGSKTFEARLEDGRWLQISERRTQDGGFVSVGTDITQLKRNEEKLRHSEKRLQATVEVQRQAQRKTDLQAQRLVELAEKYNAEKTNAEAANQAKSDFLANISHELRTPLNAIIGFSDIMQSNMFGPLGSHKYLEYAKDIHHSGEFLLGVINDILDMSKIEAGRMPLHAEMVSLDELLDETLRIIKAQADESGIEVIQSIPESVEIEADRRAIKQVLLNLLTNAVKFTDKGGHVLVSAKVDERNIRISIEDNGVGISREALERLGQPFEQVQNQFTKNHKGTGLGLAISRSLVSLHGGSLKIRSTPEKGTLVIVRLPKEFKGETTDLTV